MKFRPPQVKVPGNFLETVKKMEEETSQASSDTSEAEASAEMPIEVQEMNNTALWVCTIILFVCLAVIWVLKKSAQENDSISLTQQEKEEQARRARARQQSELGRLVSTSTTPSSMSAPKPIPSSISKTAEPAILKKQSDTERLSTARKRQQQQLSENTDPSTRTGTILHHASQQPGSESHAITTPAPTTSTVGKTPQPPKRPQPPTTKKRLPRLFPRDPVAEARTPSARVLVTSPVAGSVVSSLRFSIVVEVFGGEAVLVDGGRLVVTLNGHELPSTAGQPTVSIVMTQLVAGAHMLRAHLTSSEGVAVSDVVEAAFETADTVPPEGGSADELAAVQAAAEASRIEEEERQARIAEQRSLSAEAELIRQMQNEEYEASLAADREKEELRAALALEEARQAAVRTRREENRRSPPEEPDSEGAEVCSVALRLPDGSRVTRRYLNQWGLKAIFDTALHYCYLDFDDATQIQLRTTYPRKIWLQQEHGDTPLSEASLHPQGMIFVERRDA